MEKEFFDVFPSLKLKDQLKEWLEMVTVSRVTCNPAKTRLWVYIHSERWIHKKFIFALEDQIERQCFPGMEMRVTVIERFHLSKQYEKEEKQRRNKKRKEVKDEKNKKRITCVSSGNNSCIINGSYCTGEG